jgi:SNF2 family DNA or RNA helicase
MRVSITLWKDAILLHWDRILPPELQAKYENLDEEAKATWDPFVEIKAHWRWIGNYIHFSERRKMFVMNFSAQNLYRLKKQFGEFEVSGGAEKLKELRTRYDQFRDMREKGLQIKTTETPEPLTFKKPPRGLYQHQGVLFLLYVRFAGLFADCGLGKTYMVLVSTEIQIQRGVIRRGKTLICGKLMTFETGWVEDTEKFTNLKIVTLWLPPGTKRKEKLRKLLEEEADIFLINHEGLPVLEEELVAKEFEKIVVDESTVLQGFHGELARTGKIGKSLLRIAAKAEWRVIMSGTPASNGIEGLWGQFRFIDTDGFLLEPDFHDFRTTFMDQVYIGTKPAGESLPGMEPKSPIEMKKWVQLKGSAEKVASIINPCVFRAELREHLKDMPPLTSIVRKIPMDKTQELHYWEMRKNLSTVVNDEFISVDQKVHALMKLRQITGGFLIDQEQREHPLKVNPKMEALDALLTEEISQEKKVIIYAEYVYEIEEILKRYKDDGIVSVYGGNSGVVNLANVKAFINDPSIRLIVLHPRSAAHGITFVNAHYMIFYSQSYSAENNYQCVKRIERGGQTNAMFVYYLVCKAQLAKKTTIDEDIHVVVKEKLAAQSELISQQQQVNASLLNLYRG